MTSASLGAAGAGGGARRVLRLRGRLGVLLGGGLGVAHVLLVRRGAVGSDLGVTVGVLLRLTTLHPPRHGGGGAGDDGGTGDSSDETWHGVFLSILGASSG